MTAPDLINRLAARGVSVRIDAGLLRVRPAAAIPADLRAALLELKPKLLELLQSGAGDRREYSDRARRGDRSAHFRHGRS